MRLRWLLNLQHWPDRRWFAIGWSVFAVGAALLALPLLEIFGFINVVSGRRELSAGMWSVFLGGSLMTMGYLEGRDAWHRLHGRTPPDSPV